MERAKNKDGDASTALPPIIHCRIHMHSLPSTHSPVLQESATAPPSHLPHTHSYCRGR